MFQTALGVKIPFPEKMKEEYQVFEHGIRFNLSFEKLRPMLEEFLEGLPEPLFLVLHLPLSQQEEAELERQESDPFHQKVCYLDGQSIEQIRGILGKYGDLLLNDGMSQFAIASHASHEEMFIQKYKLIDIYCDDPPEYFELLKKYGLKQTDELVTAWDTFTREAPGEVSVIRMNGVRVYDAYDELVKLGMYEAKIIED